jgi:hypothetical protein
MKTTRLFISIAACFLFITTLKAQDEKKTIANTHLFAAKPDSLPKKDSPVIAASSITKKDTLFKPDPKKATRRSAILPGWGQAYNRQYWKMPLVYGIMAIPVGFYIYNNNYYQKTKYAYDALFRAQKGDSSLLPGIDPELQGISINNMLSYRNSFRRDRDYSILWFIITWGLQVVDASVSAHLLNFDVSDDLSMQIKPKINDLRTPGVSIALNVKSPTRRVPIAR